VSSITNQSRYIVRIRRCPEHTREFPHIKAAEAKAYRDQLLRDHNLVAEIVRGPLRLLLRIRERGVNVSEVRRFLRGGRRTRNQHVGRSDSRCRGRHRSARTHDGGAH
jgi:uncharacterized protein (UPF0128 family)